MADEIVVLPEKETALAGSSNADDLTAVDADQPHRPQPSPQHHDGSTAITLPNSSSSKKHGSSEDGSDQLERKEHHPQQQRNTTNNSASNHLHKRGMKPRSKRNRKRPLSDVYSNDSIVLQTKVVPLQIEGQTISAAAAFAGSTSPSFLRLIEPYLYAFSTFAKQRWIGRTVLDVYSTEFGSYPSSYYEAAIQQGRILVNDQIVAPTYGIRGNEILTHSVHRHEPAVAVSTNTSPYLTIVAETSDLLVVDKPATLPVHPCGGYHENTLMKLLETESIRHPNLSWNKLYTIHRLDRLTSGLLIVGKTSAVAQQWGAAIKQREHCQKIYLARVKGRFPLNCPPQLPRLDARPESEHDPDHSNNNSSKQATLPKLLLPLYGEWLDRQEPSKTDTTAEAYQLLRARNAFGYWITNSSGRIDRHTTMQRLTQGPEHCVDESPILQGLGCEKKAYYHDDDEAREAENANLQTDPLWFHLVCPTRIEQPKGGVCSSSAFHDLDEALYVKTVKAAHTAFGIVNYDAESDSTLLLCQPMTGRTHQIRTHLQFLGHSIANDPCYGGEIWYHNPAGQEACRKAQAILDTEERDPMSTPRDAAALAAQSGRVTTDEPATRDEVAQLVTHEQRSQCESNEDFIKRTCVWCARNCSGREDRAVLEFLVRSPGIWLHALQYSVRSDKSAEPSTFQTRPPAWTIK